MFRLTVHILQKTISLIIDTSEAGENYDKIFDIFEEKYNSNATTQVSRKGQKREVLNKKKIKNDKTKRKHAHSKRKMRE